MTCYRGDSRGSGWSISQGRYSCGAELDRKADEARAQLANVEPFSAERIEAELRALAERLGLKPRQAFQPIRIAVTGSKVSPGLFESLELLGREESLARLDRALSASS